MKKSPLDEMASVINRLVAIEDEKSSKRLRGPYLSVLEAIRQLREATLPTSRCKDIIMNLSLNLSLSSFFSFSLPFFSFPPPFYLPFSLPLPFSSLLIVSDPSTLLDQYFKLFSSKSCCFDDMSTYMSLLSKEEQSKVSILLVYPCILLYVSNAALAKTRCLV